MKSRGSTWRFAEGWRQGNDGRDGGCGQVKDSGSESGPGVVGAVGFAVMSDEHADSIILASGSPRRRELMAKAGYSFRVVPSGVDESAFAVEGMGAEEYARRLALAKARDVAGRFRESVVIGADTVVDLGGEIIGKPGGAGEAEEITRKLFGAHLGGAGGMDKGGDSGGCGIVHKVITGVAVVRLSDGTEIVDSDSTLVFVRPMTERRIAEHVRRRDWRGKAGAYSIKEHGDEFVERIEGSMANVMGLPVELLGRMLAKVSGPG